MTVITLIRKRLYDSSLHNSMALSPGGLFSWKIAIEAGPGTAHR